MTESQRVPGGIVAYISLAMAIIASLVALFLPVASLTLSIAAALLSLAARSTSVPGTANRQVANVAFVLSVLVTLSIIGIYLSLVQVGVRSGRG